MPDRSGFSPLPRVLDHPALEREIMELWDGKGTFDALRELNRGGPRWSFIDGPITANNPAGVHHCHGRTLKDVFQRYKALQGFDQRYQNGFDCQGLWVEVEVEKSLGLNSKQEIEEYGLAEFAQRCKERVAKFGEVITEQSKRLGMWMDWDNDYYTFSDTNIEYIWRFLKVVHERGWLYQGDRATQWCPRCGTSLSKHEQLDSYAELTHPSLSVRLPLLDREGESLAIWTTTPWTLPANVAVAVDPAAEYVLLTSGEWVAAARFPDARVARTARGEELIGWRYRSPFDGLPVQHGVEHRVVPWSDVSMDEGTGLVHIAPGCGEQDFELGRIHGLPVLVPIDESGRFVQGYDEFSGMTTDDVAGIIVEELRGEGLLMEHGAITHRYPICWRCATPLVFRVVQDWFISANEVRGPMLDANAIVEWTPSFYKKRMDDWLRNMGDWNISRKRYFGLPLPLYPCRVCDHLNVIGSRAELQARATTGLDQLVELHRPWIDEVMISCEHCGDPHVRRISDVGDAWLDAGIVPFSTLGWESPESVPGGHSTGAADGLSGADLPDHAYWHQWYPANWICEMREQIRLWFYSQSFMSVTLVGRSPYERVLTYEKVLDETGREMHKSWGNSIEVNEALDRMGADVMRWMYSVQVPSQPLKFGYGPAGEIQRRLLTLWNSAGFFLTYAAIEDYRPQLADLDDAAMSDTWSHALDRWLMARTAQLVHEATDGYEQHWTPAVVASFDRYLEDLSNWYIRRSRRRFYGENEQAFRALWTALVQSLRIIAPIMPFLAEFLWQRLVVAVCDDAPASVFLAGWPNTVPDEDREQVLAEMAEVRRVVELGRQARAQARLKLRQPVGKLVVDGAPLAAAHAAEIADELRVREVTFGAVPTMRTKVKPNLPVLGPRIGAALPDVRSALEAGRFQFVESGGVRVADRELGPDEIMVEKSAPSGWQIASEDGVHVALSTELDHDLVLEGRVLELIHHLNRMRKDRGLHVTDRVMVRLPAEYEDLRPYHEWIARDVLAVGIETAVGSTIEIELASSSQRL